MIVLDPTQGRDPIYGEVCNFLSNVINNPGSIDKKQVQESRKLTDDIRRMRDMDEYDNNDSEYEGYE